MGLRLAFERMVCENNDNVNGTDLLVMSRLTAKNTIFPATKDMLKIARNCARRTYFVAYFYHGRGALSYVARELYGAVTLLRHAKRFRTVIFHQINSTMSAFLARILRKKVVVYVGGSIFEELIIAKTFVGNLAGWGAYVLWKTMLSQSDIVAMPSLVLARQNEFRFVSHKIRICPTRLVDTEFYCKFRMLRSLDDRINIIGYVGRLSAEKGVLEFISSIPHILSLRKDVRFVVVGDGPLRKEIEESLSTLDIAGNTELTGWVNNPEAYLNEMKLLVLPSKSEGLPSVILEAMACGTPVLASRVGEATEIVRNGETGFFIDSVDPDSIAEAIGRLIDDPILLRRVSEKARNWLKENYYEDRTMSIWQKTLHECSAT